jgi:hypothetical protein
VKIRYLWWALLLALVHPATAGDPLNSQPNWVAAAFINAPAAVAVDIVEMATGTQVGNNLPATQVGVDGGDSIYWRFDLATATGYPAGCEVKSYTVIFSPDGADCQEGATPEVCATVTRQVGGASCFATANSNSYIHTSTTVGGQGIDQLVLDFYNQRGTLPLLWIETDISSSYDYTAPDETIWEVYFYTSTASAPRVLCTVKTSTNPSGSLPSYTHCS